jgi:SAM-dependent methyltransferase
MDPPRGDWLRELMPRQERIAGAVVDRYDGLAREEGSLGCGRAMQVGAPAAGEVVVDLGCGRGAELQVAARAVGRAGVVIGVDLSAEMLAQARDRIDEGRVLLLRGELAALGLAGASVDLVASNCAINHTRDKAAVYREIERVLRPGGRFVVSDIVAEREVPEAVRGDPAAWAGCYGGAILEAELLRAIAAAGLEEVTVLTRSAPYERSGVALRSVTIRGQRPRGPRPEGGSQSWPRSS